jgi:hypothetical protein
MTQAGFRQGDSRSPIDSVVVNALGERVVGDSGEMYDYVYTS